ncbi:MAG: hypothetical protein ACRYGA_13850 [Janthinobacterium lividum]
MHEAWNRATEWRIALFVEFLRPLPPRMFNSTMLALVRRTRFAQIAAKDRKQWKTSFYGQDAQPEIKTLVERAGSRRCATHSSRKFPCCAAC